MKQGLLWEIEEAPMETAIDTADGSSFVAVPIGGAMYKLPVGVALGDPGFSNTERAEELEFSQIEDRMTAREYIDLFCSSAQKCWQTYFDYDLEGSAEDRAKVVQRLVRNLGHCLQAWPRADVVKAQSYLWSHVVKLTALRPPVGAKQVYQWLAQALNEDIAVRDKA